MIFLYINFFTLVLLGRPKRIDRVKLKSNSLNIAI